MKTKNDFNKNDYDFSALKRATKVKVHKTDGTNFIANVLDYWWQDDETADVVDAVIEDGPLAGGAILHFPSPDIERVEILESQEKENHGSHPEIGFEAKNIDKMYNIIS
jgi:hypothetical protein